MLIDGGVECEVEMNLDEFNFEDDETRLIFDSIITTRIEN